MPGLRETIQSGKLYPAQTYAILIPSQCDRCADEGGVAKHSSHKFEFSIPTTVVPKPGESSSANRLPNPEA